MREMMGPGECPNISDNELDLCSSRDRRFVEKCIECHLFRRDIQAMREEGNPLAVMIPALVAETVDLRARLGALQNFLDTRNREISFIHDLTTVLQSSMELEEVLATAMTAITAGKGFGMNRAFLLMTDRERKELVGYLGVGPRDYEEAWRIWEDLDRNDYSLRAMALNFQHTKLMSEKYKFQKVLDRLSVPLAEEDHILLRALRERKTLLVENARSDPAACNGIGDILGVDSFLVMPLVSRHRRVGVILADNFITRRPIAPQDMRSLETFAFPVAFALERASLYERLNEEVNKLTVANLTLHEQQERLVKMEQMALVGRITASVAHSIRNPLMVIGGFVRSLAKGGVEEAKRPLLDSILAEAKRLELALDDVIAYSESQHPVMDRWDLNQLLTAAVSEVSPQAASRGVILTLELQPSLPPVLLDFKQISYCARSIILHALEACGDPGELRVASRHFDQSLFVEVLDRRHTMATETVDVLVNLPPFNGTEVLGKEIGLRLCRIIVERHGGDFEIMGLPEGWTLYTMRLPEAKEVRE
jgi:hypothetical protein